MEDRSNPSWQFEPRCVSLEGYLISTDREIIDHDALNEAFGSEWMWWAGPLPIDIMKRMVENSLCVGAYLCNVHGGKRFQAVFFTGGCGEV
jgi:hypothetical protein